MNDVYSMITINDLTDDLALLADSCGLEVVQQLLRDFSGINFYVPRICRLEKFIERYLNNNKGKNFKQMAKELNISEYHLRVLRKKFGIK